MSAHASQLLVGVQEPRLSHHPVQHSSAGQAAVDLAAAAGLVLDPWQRYCVKHILGERGDVYYNDVLDTMMPKSSAYESAIVVSRQNGKGAILEAVELAWLYLLGVRCIVHSAHEFATSREHFLRMETLISNTSMLSCELARGGIKWSHGDESINLATGQRLLFKTRTRGAARGFSPDKIVFDEAMKIKPEHVAAMKYAASARPNPQFIYTGSASSTQNKEEGESIHFGKARDRGIKGNDSRLFFAEWSADACGKLCPSDCDEHDDPSSPETWAKANPGMGYRIQEENVRSEYLGDDTDVFMQERLSVGDWPVTGNAWGVIDEESWMQRVNLVSAPQAPLVFGVGVSPDCSYACIAAAGYNGEDIEGVRQVHVEVTQNGQIYDHRRGRQWVVERVLQLAKTYKPFAVVMYKGSQAGPLYDELEEPLKKLKVDLVAPALREYAQACGLFLEAAVPRKGNMPSLVHMDQPMLTAAVAGAEQKDLSELWMWDARSASVDLTPLIACTHALWGVHKADTTPTPAEPWALYG